MAGVPLARPKQLLAQGLQASMQSLLHAYAAATGTPGLWAPAAASCTGPASCTQQCHQVDAMPVVICGRSAGPPALAGALSRALCMINALRVGGEAPPGQEPGQRSPARILSITASPDEASQYMAVMNAIFAAQVPARSLSRRADGHAVSRTVLPDSHVMLHIRPAQGWGP